MKNKIVKLVVSLMLTGSLVHADDTAVEALNTLLVGEMSAVDTYTQALKKVGQEEGSDTLRANLKDHETAVKELQGLVAARGGSPATETGAWGKWAEVVVGSAKIIGDKASLKALKEGEEHGFDEYKEALNEKLLNADEKKVIREKLITAQQGHIKNLDLLMSHL